MSLTDLQNLHTAVWEFRVEMQDIFPTPGRNDSLAFAFTEAAEAVDAELRLNPIYKRNSDKAHTVGQELTQCAIMLLTAIPSDFRAWADMDLYEAVFIWTPRQIAIRVAHCLKTPSDTAYILQTVAIIAPAVDLLTTLPAELSRWKAKHKPYSGEIVGWRRAKVTVVNNAVAEPEPGDMNQWQWWNDEPIRYPQKGERLIVDDYAEWAGV